MMLVEHLMMAYLAFLVGFDVCLISRRCFLFQRWARVVGSVHSSFIGDGGSVHNDDGLGDASLASGLHGIVGAPNEHSGLFCFRKAAPYARTLGSLLTLLE
jgi:hypothetical protein